MNVLVCGGAGYIGSNMTALLAAEGHEPIVYDNFGKGHRSAVRGVQVVAGDLADFQGIVRVLKERKIEAVMHFAASIEVGESVQEPLRYYRNNLSNTQNLLSAMEAAGVQKFVFSSTAAVYGMPEKVPITEDAPKKPINPYGETKLAVERMCRYQSQTGRLHYAALRYFNACGAIEDASIGEAHNPETHLIPLILDAAIGKRKCISVFGSDYDTPDGTCIRDYVHVTDLARAHLLTLDALRRGEGNKTYNLGNGRGFSVNEVIEACRRATGRRIDVEHAPRRPGDPARLVASSERIRSELGWTPRYTSLESIVETAWRWHIKYRKA